MLRFLVWLILGAVAWLFWRAALGAVLGGGKRGPGPRVGRGPGQGRSGGGEIRGEELVRDRVCQTYLPRSKALSVVDADGREHFFCSEACKAKHAGSAP